MYWRRFAVADMPLDDHDKFDIWLRERWAEKDAIMDGFITSGRFPPSKSIAVTNGINKGEKVGDGFVETEVKLAHWWEIGNIFIVLATVALITNLGARAWNTLLYGRQY
jgi:lysocardiolipin and lysophospholipid acyltransferase